MIDRPQVVALVALTIVLLHGQSALPVSADSPTPFPTASPRLFASQDMDRHIIVYKDGARSDLTQGFGGVRAFEWSPDCRDIAFIGSPGGEGNIVDGDDEIYLVDLRSGQITRVTNNHVPEDVMKWSPDGKRIAFSARATAHENDELWIINVDGTGLQQLSQHDKQQRLSEEIRNIVWSADSQQIAYSTSAGRAANSLVDLFEIYATKVDGSNWHDVTRGENVSWLPDGHQLIYELWRNPQNYINRINVDGSGQQVLVEGGMPVVSPDGQWLAFFVPYVISIEHLEYIDLKHPEKPPVEVALPPDFDLVGEQPLWSRDGTQILYHDHGTSGLFYVEVDLQDPTARLADLPGQPCPW